MRGSRQLRLLQVTPFLAATLLVAVWFSVPGELRGTMLSMAASGAPSEPTVGMPEIKDRRTIAAAYFDRAAERRARREWADVRFQQVARRTWIALPDSVREATTSAGVPALGRTHPALAALRAFSEDFPDAQIDAYIVSWPPMPPVAFSEIAEGAALPEDAFAYAWRLSNRRRTDGAFDPGGWNGRGPVLASFRGVETLRQHTTEYEGELYTTFAYSPPSFGKAVDPPKFHGRTRRSGVRSELSGVTCEICHVEHASIGQSGAIPYPLPSALFVGGPLRFEPRVLYSTRETREPAAIGEALVRAGVARTDTALFPTSETSLLSEHVDGDRWLSLRWVSSKDWSGISGPTMLFAATFPQHPHAEYEEWRRSAPVEAWFGTRIWLALQLPWLLAVAAILLGVSLLASRTGFALAQQQVTQQKLAEEFGRIERDAHDRVYNRMTALSKRVEEAADAMPPEPAKELEGVAADIRGTLAELQGILAGRPGAEDCDSSLATQLKAIAAAQSVRHRTAVDFEGPENLPAVAAQLGWDLQCALEEAITNAVRHGGAKRVHIALTLGPDVLVLRVEDDGAGESLETRRDRPRPTGLEGMSRRLARWGGSVRLQRLDGRTLLTVTVPLGEDARRVHP